MGGALDHSLFESTAAVASAEASLRQGRIARRSSASPAMVPLSRRALYRRLRRGHGMPTSATITRPTRTPGSIGCRMAQAPPSPAGRACPAGTRCRRRHPRSGGSWYTYVATASVPSGLHEEGRAGDQYPRTYYIRCILPAMRDGVLSQETLAMVTRHRTGLWVNYEIVNGGMEKVRKVGANRSSTRKAEAFPAPLQATGE